jgi:hypothetical protein
MPLDAFNEDIHSVIDWQMSGTMDQATADQLSTWDGSAYVKSWQVDTGGSMPTFDGLWYDTGGGPSVETIHWGEGFWLTTKTAAETIWVEGEVADPGSTWQVFVPGSVGGGEQILVGHPWPMDDPLDGGMVDNVNYEVSGGTTGNDASEADVFYTYPCGDQYYASFLSPGFGWWQGAVVSPEILSPTEGWWIYRGTNTTGSFTWYYPAPY